MPFKFIVCDPNLCTGCHLCELACALEKSGQFDPELSCIHTSQPRPDLTISVACHLCEDTPCITACPRDALSVNPRNGTIVLEKSLCTGCGWCIEACDFGAIALDRSTKSVLICNLCEGLPEPRCIESCPKQALTLSSSSVLSKKALDKKVEELRLHYKSKRA